MEVGLKPKFGSMIQAPEVWLTGRSGCPQFERPQRWAQKSSTRRLRHRVATKQLVRL